MQRNACRGDCGLWWRWMHVGGCCGACPVYPEKGPPPRTTPTGTRARPFDINRRRNRGAAHASLSVRTTTGSRAAADNVARCCQSAYCCCLRLSNTLSPSVRRSLTHFLYLSLSFSVPRYYIVEFSVSHADRRASAAGLVPNRFAGTRAAQPYDVLSTHTERYARSQQK